MTAAWSRGRPAHGFSTLEALIAGTLLLLAVTGVVSALSTTSNLYAHQRHLTQAISIGELAMEELLLRYRGSPDLASGMSHEAYFAADGSSADASDARYTVIWDVSPTRVAGVVRRVDCRVQWWEGSRERHIDFFTYRP